jgi:DNA-binding transcriptional regulator YhcF (GntR family)
VSEPPYLRIAAELRDRITAGQLRPGDRLPTIRDVARDWGVAIATATRALAVLRQEGVVHAVPRVGTVVAERRPAATRRSPTGSADRTRARIVRAAIDLADAEGYAALSMRRIATTLDLATMSLYRHVRGRDDLVVAMLDAVCGEHPLPADRPAGWRAGVEQALRTQWAVHRAHPWTARVMSFTRPPIAPNAIAYTEHSLRALAGVGLDPATTLHIAVSAANYVRGTAVNLESEAEDQRETGLTQQQWNTSQDVAFAAVLASGRFPAMAALADGPEIDLGVDILFEFGLARLLDGVTDLIRG